MHTQREREHSQQVQFRKERERKTKQRRYIKSRNDNPLLYSRLFTQKKKKKKKKAISYHKVMVRE